MPFTLTRQPHEIVRRSVVLTAREQLSPRYLRLRLEGDDLRSFDSAGAADHIKLFFPGEKEDARPPMRDYTPLRWDTDAGVLEIEFVVHGDDGVAGPWARDAALGSTLSLGGPRGSLVLDGTPDSWFIAVDETGIPAARRYLWEMAPEASGTVLVEVDGPEAEIAIDRPAAIDLLFVHRDAGRSLTTELDALSADDRPTGDVLFFAAAEQSIVKSARELALDRWSLPDGHIQIKGYWKRGTADHDEH